MFESKKDRRIRELEADNECLREESRKQANRLNEMSVALKKALKALEEKNGELRRSAFAEEVGLLPCESPACKFCKNAVWRTEADGRHIAGCKKGIRCADFEEAEPKKEAAKPVSVNVITPPVSPFYPTSSYPISSALLGPHW